MAIFLCFFGCIAFWLWMFGVIGWQVLLCTIGILVCLIMLSEPGRD